MKPRTKVVWQLLTFLGIPAAVLLLPLVVGIWLPDVFVDHTHVLAEANSPEGHRFRVEQYWNHVDFYTTNLLVIHPNGTVTTHLIDADDSKCWSVPLVVDERRRTVAIILNDDWVCETGWDDRTPVFLEPVSNPYAATKRGGGTRP